MNLQILVIVVLLFLAVAAIIWAINKYYLSRIKRLTDLVERYAEEKDLEIVAEIEKDAVGDDEISLLERRIAEMLIELDNYTKTLVRASEELIYTRTQMNVMSKVAHRDALTGIRNRTAYQEKLRRLNWERSKGKVEFGIAVVDLNNLKKINDTYGHESGNVAIRNFCKMVCSVFCHSPVFRIGGDEFAIVLENDDYRNIDALIEQLYKEQEALKEDFNLEVWERFSAAVGYALYDPSIDENATDVFRRADEEMYKKKKQMHAGRS